MDASTVQNLAAPACQDLHRGLVAPAFDENDPLRLAEAGQIDTYPGDVHDLSAAACPPGRNPHHRSLLRQASSSRTVYSFEPGRAG